jgi:hypothetical protein
VRRDVFIENDSGGLSILASDAVDAIIEDGRSDDLRFVNTYKALLLELYGDDSMPVRIVVDEPLRPDEEEQWLARASWRIDTTDGQMLVMGGFDPDVLSDWKDESGGEGDAAGIGTFSAVPGSWRIDLYAHVGSMNGRQILKEADERPGAAFRRSHPGNPVPLWLARLLEFSHDEDPGFDEVWQDIPASMAAGSLTLDADSGDAIGFLVHCMPFNGSLEAPPADGWFGRTTNQRVPATFPIGIASDVSDRGLQHFRNRVFGIREPEPTLPAADRVTEIIEAWTGDPLKKLDGAPVPVALTELYLLYWMAALTSDATPLFELWIEPKGEWTAPASTPEFASISKGKSIKAIGPAPDSRGWMIWFAARDVAASLGDVPDGSTITLAMAPRRDSDNQSIGRALYEATVRNGQLQIIEASPRVGRDVLEEAVRFTRAVAIDGAIEVRPGAERQAFDKAAGFYSPEEGSVGWDGDVARLADPDDRTLLMLASAVFRARYGTVWPADVDEEY